MCRGWDILYLSLAHVHPIFACIPELCQDGREVIVELEIGINP